MERNIVRLFEHREDAAKAIQELDRLGIDRSDVSIVSTNEAYAGDTISRASDETEATDNKAGEGAMTGASTGALVGGGAGLLAGLGLLAIPGLGPIVAAGWLASMFTGTAAGAVVGGATGGLIGGLIKSGVPEKEAHIYSEGVDRGGTLVSVRNAGARTQEVEAALDSFRAADVHATGERYRASGWQGSEVV
ncbi:MAG: hypothetical protein ACK46Q_07835 [Hyphomonas sp.]